MSGSNSKIWLLVVVMVVLGGVGVYVLTGWLGERSDRKVITSQANEWGELWASARACIVGPEPASQVASEALLAFEGMQPSDPDRLRQCEKQIRTLTRPGDEQTGDAKVEASWDALAKATRAVGNGIVANIDAASLRPYQDRRAKLATALDGLDAAYAELRAVSGMDPVQLPGPAELPKLAAGVVVNAGEQPVAPSQVTVLGDMLVIDGQRSGDAWVQAALRGVDQIALRRSTEGTMRAADDASWGLWFRSQPDETLDLLTGPIDEAGKPTGEGVVAISVGSDDQISAHMALGKGNARAIVYQQSVEFTDQGVFVIRSTDSGKTWSAPAALTPPPISLIADTARRRLDVVWKDESNLVRWLSLRADRVSQTPRPKRLFDAGADVPGLSACLAERAGWWLSELQEVYYVAGDSKTGRQVSTDGQQIVSIGPCDEQTALIRLWTNEGLEIQACGPSECKTHNIVPVPNGGEYAVAITRAQGPIMVTRINHLLLSWKLSGGEPTPYALPVTDLDQVGTLQALIEWDGALHAALITHERAQMYRLK